MDFAHTVNFRDWFGASKVVDKDGEPLIVHHVSTADQPIDVFDTAQPHDIGAHFGSEEEAHERETWLKRRASAFKNNPSKFTYFKVYLNIGNPIELEDNGKWDVDEMVDQLTASHGLTFSQHNKWMKFRDDLMKLPDDSRLGAIKKFLQGLGYDGVIYRNQGEIPSQTHADYATEMQMKADYQGRSYIAFEPSQIKSATENSGAFDINNPNILK